MTPLIAALQFLTIFPLGKPCKASPDKFILSFPLVGIILGGLVAILDRLFVHAGSPLIAASLDTALLALATGALHLDGLADAADGLFAHRKKEKALAIMKDSRIGAMGLVVVVCTLLVKVSGLASLETHRSLCLVLVPAFSRASLIPAVYFLPYCRSPGGTGAFLFEKPLSAWVLSGFFLPVIASLWLGAGAIRVNLVFIGITASMILFYRKRLGCITGDMLGAMVEVTESVLFCATALGGVR